MEIVHGFVGCLHSAWCLDLLQGCSLSCCCSGWSVCYPLNKPLLVLNKLAFIFPNSEGPRPQSKEPAGPLCFLKELETSFSLAQLQGTHTFLRYLCHYDCLLLLPLPHSCVWLPSAILISVCGIACQENLDDTS